ncbi:hypothetical protein ACFWV1_06055 [Streptomyces sp. NPDC058700]|uniref:hypothetical protein n=1 Tax=Streptomyces sp. NPDC058700 TaxID=3346607 RepID=UPI00364B9179
MLPRRLRHGPGSSRPTHLPLLCDSLTSYPLGEATFRLTSPAKFTGDNQSTVASVAALTLTLKKARPGS